MCCLAPVAPKSRYLSEPRCVPAVSGFNWLLRAGSLGYLYARVISPLLAINTARARVSQGLSCSRVLFWSLRLSTLICLRSATRAILRFAYTLLSAGFMLLNKLQFIDFWPSCWRLPLLIIGQLFCCITISICLTYSATEVSLLEIGPKFLTGDSDIWKM